MGALQVTLFRSASVMLTLLFLLAVTMVAHAQSSVDSTWSYPTVLLDTNEDDTLDYTGQRVKIGGIVNTAFPQIHTTRLASFIQNDEYGLPFFLKL